MKLPFKTRKQLKLEIEHLTEQLSIQGDERKKDNARYNQQIKDLEETNCELLTKQDCDEHNIAGLLREIDRIKPLDEENKRLQNELMEQKDINAGLISTVNELKEKIKKHLARIKALEAKQPEKKTPKPKKQAGNEQTA